MTNSPDRCSADICDAAVDRAMTSFQQAVNSMVSCKRCNGTGYHHGFGEHGHDPDWCEVCNGCQSVPEFDDREAMREALKAAMPVVAQGSPKHDHRVYFACECCHEHAPENGVCCREDIAVMPDGTWLCDSCYSDCDKAAYGMVASDIDDFEFPRFEDLPRPAPYAAQPPAAPVEKRPPGAGPAGATFGGFEPLSPPQSCSADKESARELGETIVAETERLLELEAAFFVSLVSNGLPADVGELLTHGSARQGIPPRLIQKAIKAAIPLNIERERDEARQLVIEANNSLYGSQGYFHSLNGGAFDKYHLSRGIEDLKERLRAVPQRAAEWQPFETAPKVGEFLVYMPEEHRKLQVMYRNERMTVVAGAFGFDMTKPTHWMPAPDTSTLPRPKLGGDK